MYLTKELAFEIEDCIKHTHIEMANSFPLGKILELGGGAACFAGLSSFFSQVVAWGFELKSKQFKPQIEAIEDFYRSCGHSRVDLELCPLVGNDLLIALGQRGYRITEMNNISFLDLAHYSLNEEKVQFEIRQIASHEVRQWAKTIALGFGYIEAQEQFIHYAQLKGVRAFAVYDNEQIVAGATIAIHGPVADLGVTSTLPAYRNRGLQKLLLKERLKFAIDEALPLVTVTTEPGSISDLNIQKIGFRCAYTRVKMTLTIK
ncbi:GNAT family N-acetyltransferase [Legionella sp. km772]|uniref:GNAT family N-acetyltransferase n=1 Tax=Legionella sp. km772 TaxID=2498111 RepID=UPI000F8D2CF7|nr:GNAT family N-acetyltransferase [Legionella sp. km772]RUR10090.1 GNAT family N-acetyltransferase [Legionella sp. km772]